jgi:hypothetical protein
MAAAEIKIKRVLQNFPTSPENGTCYFGGDIGAKLIAAWMTVMGKDRGVEGPRSAAL